MKLMNSAMMPQEGLYHCQKITKEQFCRLVVQTHESGELQNYIGYQQNLDLIAEWTGIRLAPNREVFGLNAHDGLLIMRLKYRVGPGMKKFCHPSGEDFEFFVATYNAADQATGELLEIGAREAAIDLLFENAAPSQRYPHKKRDEDVGFSDLIARIEADGFEFFPTEDLRHGYQVGDFRARDGQMYRAVLDEAENDWELVPIGDLLE